MIVRLCFCSITCSKGSQWERMKPGGGGPLKKKEKKGIKPCDPPFKGWFWFATNQSDWLIYILFVIIFTIAQCLLVGLGLFDSMLLILLLTAGAIFFRTWSGWLLFVLI